MQIRDKIVVITGAGNGVGAAMARRFAAEGAAGICVSDVQEDTARAVAGLVARTGCRAIAVGADTGDEAQVRGLIDATYAELGPVDLMCSNAGVATGMGLGASAEQWAAAWSVNVQAHVYAAKAVIPDMIRRGDGYLLNTCAAAGLLTQPGDAPYAVTKHAAIAFAEWLAVTYGGDGVKVSALCPQGVRTPLLTGDPGSGGEKILEPDEVADAVIEGLDTERFLILPNPVVAEFERRKAADRDRWLSGVRKMVGPDLG